MADPTVYEIPLTPTPQRFTITLSQVSYRMTVKYADAPGGGWMLDIADVNGVAIVNGIPLVTGANLLAAYEYLGLSGALVVQTDHDTDAVPTFDNLGTESHLFFVP